MISLADVSKVYRTTHKEVLALNNVSLTVDAGQFVAVRGHSGSGKSTLLSIVGGLAAATSGEVRVAEHELTSMTSAERARFRADTVGFVFQMFHLLPYLNIVDNVTVAASDDRKADAGERARALLDQFGLSDRLSHHPGQLSAGERQRVAMARALLNEPQLLLADEPTGNLDPKSAETLLDLLGEYHECGGTILLVTHDEAASNRAQHVVSMSQGQIEDAVAAS